ncbi:hypothetical protein QTP88_001221 [Uroleucon formosanum]
MRKAYKCFMKSAKINNFFKKTDLPEDSSIDNIASSSISNIVQYSENTNFEILESPWNSLNSKEYSTEKEVIDNVFEKYSEDHSIINSNSPPQENTVFFEPKTKTMMINVLGNGEKIKRHFFLYSENTGTLYCVPCWLFDVVSSFFTRGFSDWKKAGVNFS